MKQLYYHTGRLVRFILRRDRLRIPVWLTALILTSLLAGVSFPYLYPTAEDRQNLAEAMIVDPISTAMTGVGYGLDDYTFGAIMAHQMLSITAIIVGIMSILLVVRHTRGDEENGRIELVRSLPTGRLSNLSATLIVVCGVNVALAVLTGCALYLLQIESMDLQGSLLYGAALGAIGIFFAAVTALCAQLSESSRGTVGLAFGVFGSAYVIRAIGDVGVENLSWASPFGWILGTEVYVNNYVWPLFLTLGVAVLLIILALVFNAKRDLESGFLPSRPGRREASSFLQSPLGLSLRLLRTSVITWMIVVFVLGAISVGDMETFFADSGTVVGDFLPSVEGITTTEQLLAMVMSLISTVCTIPALLFLHRLKSEENHQRTEHLLARAVSRTRLMGSYVMVSLVGGFVMLMLAAVGLGAVTMLTIDNGPSFGMILGSALLYLPALAVMIGVSTLLIGIIPKWVGLNWLLLVYFFVVVFVGELFQFPEWVVKLTPFGMTPQLPIDGMKIGTMSIMILIAMVLMSLGFLFYNRRDIQG